jgi:hypothetical protein
MSEKGTEGETFADYPLTIGEAKSDKTRDGADWTPRDALISVLRDIDDGKVDLTGVVICMHFREGGCSFAQATPSLIHSLGIIERAKHIILTGV